MKKRLLKILMVVLSLSIIASATSIFAVSADTPAEPVNIALDSTKWERMTGAQTDGTKLGFTTDKFFFESKAIGGNSSADITLDFTGTSGSWGFVVVYFKYTPDVDACSWVWDDASPNDTSSTIKFSNSIGVTPIGAKGNWVAMLLNCATTPVLVECVDGVVYQGGSFTGLNGYDFWYTLKQKNDISVSATDTATGVDLVISYQATQSIDGTTNGKKTVSYSSTNTALRGNSGIAIQKNVGDGAYTFANTSATINVTEVASEYDVSYPVATDDFATDASNWQSLNSMVSNETGLHPTAGLFNATTKLLGGNSSATFDMDFVTANEPWGGIAFFLKWNAGVDNATISYVEGGTGEFPLNGTNAQSINITNAQGDWVMMIATHAGEPRIYECVNGEVSFVASIPNINGNDFWFLFQQQNRVFLDTKDTATGVDFVIGFEAYSAATSGARVYKYSSTNTALRGEGSFVINRCIGGGQNWNYIINPINVEVQNVASDYLGIAGMNALLGKAVMEYTAEDVAKVEKIQDEYDALPEEAKAQVEIGNLVAINEAIALANESAEQLEVAIQELADSLENTEATVETYDVIREGADAVVAAYGALPVFAKANVANAELLNDCIAALDAWYTENAYLFVIEDIENLSAIVSTREGYLTAKAAYDAVKADYDLLGEEKQALVTNADDLTAYGEALVALNADITAANTVDSLIELIDEADDRASYSTALAAYNAANNAYDALTDAQKALVLNASDLTATGTALEAFAALIANADAVDALIEAIPATIETSNRKDAETAIVAAEEAYAALTDAEKDLVEGYANLVAARATLDETPKGCGGVSMIESVILATALIMAGAVVMVVRKTRKEN